MKKLTLILLLTLSAALGWAAPVAAAGEADVTQAACALYHTVSYGETLAIIAARYGTSITALTQLNNLSNINRIYYGTQLCVRLASSAGFYYTVQRGDTLTKIGIRYGWSVSYLATVNNLRNINYIYSGQVLLIPKR